MTPHVDLEWWQVHDELMATANWLVNDMGWLFDAKDTLAFFEKPYHWGYANDCRRADALLDGPNGRGDYELRDIDGHFWEPEDFQYIRDAACECGLPAIARNTKTGTFYCYRHLEHHLS